MGTIAQLTSDKLLVNLNENAQMTDLCWPVKGENNLLLRNKIYDEIRVNDKKISHKYKSTFINNDDSYVQYDRTESELDIRLTLRVRGNSIRKAYHLTNLGKNTTRVELFIISQPDFGSNYSRDAAIFYPQIKGIIHYEGNCYLSVYSDHTPTQYTCQAPEDFDGRGARPDKEGDLNMNPVTIGRIESCLKYEVEIDAGEYKEIVINYLFTENLEDAEKVFSQSIQSSYLPKPSDDIRQRELGSILDLSKTELEKLEQLVSTSEYIVKGAYNQNGSIFAAVDTTYFKEGGVDDYSYFWPRDGALISLARIRHEQGSEQLHTTMEKYFEFVLKCFGNKPYLMHRFKLSDGSLGSSWHPWVNKLGKTFTPLQLDQTALTVYTYSKYKLLTGNKDEKLEMKLEEAIQFLLSQINDSGLHKDTYDLWENHWGTFLSEQASLIAALTQAKKAGLGGGTITLELIEKLTTALSQNFLTEEGIFIRGQITESDAVSYDHKSLDASFHWLWDLELLDPNDQNIINTVTKAESILKIGEGFARYENDHYLKADLSKTGNPWYITTMWFARYYLLTDQFPKAKSAIKFVLDHMDHTGLLPEMADPNTGISLSVKPLIWSHAEVLNLLNWNIKL